MKGVGKKITLDVIEAAEAQGRAGANRGNNFQVPGDAYRPQQDFVGLVKIMAEVECRNNSVRDLLLAESKRNLGCSYRIELQDDHAEIPEQDLLGLQQYVGYHRAC